LSYITVKKLRSETDRGGPTAGRKKKIQTLKIKQNRDNDDNEESRLRRVAAGIFGPHDRWSASIRRTGPETIA